MKISRTDTAAALGAVFLASAFQAHAQYQMERLSRGVVAVRTSSSQVYVGWRLFGNDSVRHRVQPVPLEPTAARRRCSTARR